MKKLVLICILLFPIFSLGNTKQKKIVFLGDSLTEGYGIPQNKAFPSLIEKKLKTKYPNLAIVNAGSSGSTSASAESRLKWLVKSKPSIVVIALGANDGLRGVKLKSTEANLQKAITISLKNNVQVLLAGVRIPVNYGSKYRKQFTDLFIKLSKKNKIAFMPYLLKDVAGVKGLNQSDGIHPNEKGHDVISKNMLPFIEKLL